MRRYRCFASTSNFINQWHRPKYINIQINFQNFGDFIYAYACIWKQEKKSEKHQFDRVCALYHLDIISSSWAFLRENLFVWWQQMRTMKFCPFTNHHKIEQMLILFFFFHFIYRYYFYCLCAGVAMHSGWCLAQCNKFMLKVCK